MKNSLEKFQEIFALSKEIRLIQSIDMLLEWDKETYMPQMGIKLRAMQKQYLASLNHEKKTSEEFKQALSQLIDLDSGNILANDLDLAKQAALKEWRRDFLHTTRLPDHFVKEFAKITTEATQVWAKAKEQDSFEFFSPHLGMIIDKCREMAGYITYKDHPYDALLDLHEPGMTTKQLTKIFQELKPFLVDLVDSLKDQSSPGKFLSAHYDEAAQIDFTSSLLQDMGLGKGFSRVDKTVHPFCLGLHPKDVRLTTHVHGSNLMANLLANLHEGGHGLYEAGLPEEEYGSPLGEYASIGIHESQSRIWETMIGLSFPFWRYYFPKLQKVFPKQLERISLEEFHQSINTVSPSFIRVFADEVTYCLHVILRFEIETSLIEGKMTVEDIPEAWNAQMLEMFNLVPKTDAMGCLQDIHWSLGAFGYFPTYALGNLYAAQQFEKMKKDFPDFDKRLQNGDLRFIRTWLTDNIYQYGRQFSPQELVEKATGKPFDAKPYMTYLQSKYQAVKAV